MSDNTVLGFLLSCKLAHNSVGESVSVLDSITSGEHQLQLITVSRAAPVSAFIHLFNLKQSINLLSHTLRFL